MASTSTYTLLVLAVIAGAFCQGSDNGLYDFRQAAPPTVGMLLMIAFLAIAVFFGIHERGKPWEGSFMSMATIKRLAVLILILFNIFCGLFLMFTVEWVVAFQVMFINIIGLYSFWVEEKMHIYMYMAFTLFNIFCLVGKMALFGYDTNLVDQTRLTCLQHFDPNPANPSSINNHRCASKGFLNFTRLVALVAVLTHSVVLYIGFRTYLTSVGGDGGSKSLRSTHQPIPTEDTDIYHAAPSYAGEDKAIAPPTYAATDSYQNPSNQEFE